MCQQKVAPCDLTHREHNACFFFFLLMHRSQGSLYESQKKKRRKYWGESALEGCNFKRGFEKRSDILTFIWQDQIRLQFTAALSSALGKNRANC